MGGELFSENLNQVYNPETNKWITGNSMPIPRFVLSVAVVDDVLYAIGGYDGTNYSGVNEMYTPVGYIPEFPSWDILPLLITATLVIIICRKRLAKTPSNFSKNGGKLIG